MTCDNLLVGGQDDVGLEPVDGTGQATLECRPRAFGPVSPAEAMCVDARGRDHLQPSLADVPSPSPLARSAALSDRLDELPLAHLGAARNAPLLRGLVELLPVAILERMAGAATSLPHLGCLLAQ